MKKTILCIFSLILLFSFVGCGGGSNPKDIEKKLLDDNFSVSFTFGSSVLGLHINTNGDCLDYRGNPTSCALIPSKSQYSPVVHVDSSETYPSIYYRLGSEENTIGTMQYIISEGSYISDGTAAYILVSGSEFCSFTIKGEDIGGDSYPSCVDSQLDSAKVVEKEFNEFLKKYGMSEKDFFKFFDWEISNYLKPIEETFVFTDNVLKENNVNFLFFPSKYQNYYDFDGNCVLMSGEITDCKPEVEKPIYFMIATNHTVNDNGLIHAYYKLNDRSYFTLDSVYYYDIEKDASYYFYTETDFIDAIDNNIYKYIYLGNRSCSYRIIDDKTTDITTCSNDYSAEAQAIVDDYIAFTNSIGLSDNSWVVYFEYIYDSAIINVRARIEDSLK